MTAIQLEDGYDLNALVTSGVYGVGSAMNGPAAGDFLVHVIGGNSGGNSRHIQTAYDSAGAAYVRCFTMNGWEAWALTSGVSTAGAEYAVSDLAVGQMAYISPRGGSTSITTLGTSVSASGTVSATVSADGYLESKKRVGILTGASGTNLSHVTESGGSVARGSATGEGGFSALAVFGYEDALAADFNFFCGFNSVGNALSNSDVPSVIALNAIGICRDVGDDGPSVLHSNGSSATKVDLSGTFGDFVAGDVYKLYINVPAGNEQLVTVTLSRINPGREASVTTTIAGDTSELPVAGTPLLFNIGHGNGGTATAQRLAFMGLQYQVPLL